MEFAFVAPILMVFVFGTIEFGLIFKDLLTLNQLAREGVRVGAVGAPTSEITTKITSSAATLRADDISVTMEYRIYSGGAWGAWTTLADAGTPSANSAPSGAQIRVIVEYPHALVTGRLFSRLATDCSGTAIDMRSSMVMRRE